MDCPNCSTPITVTNRGIRCLDCGGRFCATCEKDYRKPRGPGERAYCHRCFDARVEAARTAPAELLVVHLGGKPLAYQRGEFLIGDQWGGEALLLDACRSYLPGGKRGQRRGGKVATSSGEILVERGRHIVLAARYPTAPPKEARDALVSLGRRFESAYKGRIEDPEVPPLRLEGVEGIIDEIYAPKHRTPASSAPPPPPPSSARGPQPPGAPERRPSPPPPPPRAAESEAIATVSAERAASDPWFQKGLQADRGQDYDAAVGHYEKAIAADGANVRAWFNKGVALQMLDRHYEALRCYDRALVLDPSDPEIWCNKGLALRAMGRLGEALHCYDAALEIDAEDASVWSNRGVALRIMGDVEGAIRSYDRALDLNPSDAGVWSNKAVALQVLGRFDEAMRCLERALEISPGKVSAKKNLDLVRRYLRRRR